MARVLPRLPQVGLSPAEVRDLVDSFMFLADIVEPGTGQDSNLRNPADQPVLASLIAAQAHYLITGDNDLLTLAGRYPIVTPAVFWARHGT
jgi:predicted nucleic acid-binding protein